MATKKRLKLSANDFKGVFAPVFTCFKNDANCTLELNYVDKYAQWLKSEGIKGVLVNSVTGEGPALGFAERRMNMEAWWLAANKYHLLLLVQVGGAPLPDVLHLAQHAEELGVDGVVCLPELFYKPQSIRELVGFCKTVAQKCTSIPFFYYHFPLGTGIQLDMSTFCDEAEKIIPNFLGIQFSDTDLEMGVRCLREGRVIWLGSGALLASGMLLGFESVMNTCVNGRPKLFWAIYNAMRNEKTDIGRNKQREANAMIDSILSEVPVYGHIPAYKRWFNGVMSSPEGAGFSAGAARQFF